MDKFQKALLELEERFVDFKEVLVVFLYGSVARKEYSLRHSDLDLFIVLNEKEPKNKTKQKIDSFLSKISAENSVKIHPEYQGLKIKLEDASLIKKMLEEGKIICSKGVFNFSAEQIGLKPHIIYFFKAKNKVASTRLSQILHGKKSWYYKNNKKIVKDYSGLIDGKEIIGLGRGAIMVAYSRKKQVEQMFEQQDIDYKIKKIVYL